MKLIYFSQGKDRTGRNEVERHKQGKARKGCRELRRGKGRQQRILLFVQKKDAAAVKSMMGRNTFSGRILR